MGFPYDHKTLAERKRISQSLRQKYPNKLPILLKIDRPDQLLPPDEIISFTGKYIVPEDITAGKFLYEVRKNLKISAEISVFLFSGNIMVSPQSCLLTLYNQHQAEDGFLYFTLISENTFGYLM